MTSRVIGMGSYLPPNVVYNDALAATLDTSDEWIRQNTGITKRHIVTEGEGTSDMAIKAAMAALEDAKIDAGIIDGVIVATSTPDLTLPACAFKVQTSLGLSSAFAFDMQCACSGFLYGMVVANSMIASGQSKNILLIGADAMSRTIDWNDRSTCILFGDGAGAFILSECDGECGIISSGLYSDGALSEILYTDGGISSTGTAGVVKMNGRAVFKHAIAKMSEAVFNELAKHNLTVDDIDWVVPHQANIRIIAAMAERLQIPLKKVISTIGEHANTSAASIPLAMHMERAKFEPGNLVILTAVGSGLAWGALLMRW